MSEIINAEPQYRRRSFILVAAVTVFWLTMMSWLVYEKVFLEYRKSSIVDYSLIFDRDSALDFTSMGIYLDDKRFGYTRTVIQDIEGGGRVIKGSTHLTVKAPWIQGVFRMESKIYISKEKKLDSFILNIMLPFKDYDDLTITGHTEGDLLKVVSEQLGIDEEIPIQDTLISSSISPFSDIVSLKVGKQWEVGIFDPLLKRIKKVNVRVVSREVISWRDKETTVFKLEGRGTNGKLLSTAWIDEYGRLLEESINIFGLTVRLKRE